MRTGRFFRLLAGTALVASVTAPIPGAAAPERIQSAPPPPPLINGQRIIIRRDAAPPPQQQRRAAPVATTPRAAAPEHSGASDAASDAAPLPPRPRAVIDPGGDGPLPLPARDRATIQRGAAPPAPPAAATTPAVTLPAGKPPQAAEAGFDLQGVVDRLMGASDAQIAEKLRALLLNSKRLEKHAARPEERKAVESF